MNDAEAAGLLHNPIIIKRDDDRLEAPAGAEVIVTQQFNPNADDGYIVAANGGTARQLVPIILKLVESGAQVTFLDLQYDGITELGTLVRRN